VEKGGLGGRKMARMARLAGVKETTLQEDFDVEARHLQRGPCTRAPEDTRRKISNC